MAIWTPAHTAAELWFDGADPSSIILASANNMSGWEDKSPYARHLSQPSASIQPVYDPAINAVVLPALTTRLQGSAPGQLLSGPITYSMVIDYAGNGGHSGYLNFIQLTTADLAHTFWHYARSNARNLEIYTEFGSIAKYQTFGDPGKFILSVEIHNGIASIYKNGSLVVSGPFTDPNLTAMQNIFLGRGTFSSSRAFLGSYHEVVFSSELNCRERLEGYYAHKWGMVSDLYLYHPFKNNPPGTGTIAGSVKKGGAPVPNAKVFINSKDGAFNKTVTADVNGEYSQNDIGPGDYIITAHDETDPGYRPLAHRVIIE